MIILTIRTDKPEAEVGLYDDQKQLGYKTWQAHRALAETLQATIRDILSAQGKNLQDVKGIVCYKGPGSFTGLRIGLTVANALSYAKSIPIVGETGDEWIRRGIERMISGDTEPLALPEYGADVHITTPKK
jgi:tRNA threonylcarbamoyladenosine biosynthesis protein TsaB